MRGVILAGGSGTRLQPITHYLNKHLFPVYNKPMILFPIETMKSIGIDDILVITDRYKGNKLIEFLGSGVDFGVSISYKFQERPDGIGSAIKLSQSFVGKENALIMLGDNIVLDDLAPFIKEFKKGCKIFLKKVQDPQRFGVAKFDSNGNIIDIIEKPNNPPSEYAVTGIYIVDISIYEKLKLCTPSSRGELEVSDALRYYIKENLLNYSTLNKVWIDAGTFESLFEASQFVRNLELNKS